MIQLLRVGKYKNIIFNALNEKFEEKMWKIRDKRLCSKPHYQINVENSEGVSKGEWVIPTNSLYLAG